MKASLVSATSLAALLALDAGQAQAQIFTLNQSLTGTNGFRNTLVNCAAFTGCQPNALSDTATITVSGSFPTTLQFRAATSPLSGTGVTSGFAKAVPGTTVTTSYTFAPTITGAATGLVTVVGTQVTSTKPFAANTVTKVVTLSGTGVAPIENTSVSKNTQSGNGSTIAPGTSSGASVNLGYVLANNTPTSAAATITVSNTGTGNSAMYWTGSSFAPQGTVSNLTGNGSLAAAGGVSASGTNPSTVSLQDSTATTVNGFGSNGSTTATFTYNFTPTTTGTAATSTVTLSFTDGSGAGSGLTGQNKSQTVTYTITGTGVAPVASIAGTNVGYVLAGTSKSAIVTVQNTGNGNLAFGGVSTGSATVSNLFGTVGGVAGGSLFSGSGNVLLTNGVPDSSSAPAASTTQTFSYVFSPTSAIGTVSTTVTGTFTYGTGNSVSLGTAAATITGTGVAPISSVTVTRAGGNGGAVTGASGPGQASGAGAQANLGYVLVGGPSAAATVTVNNTGNGNLAGNDVSSGGTLLSNLHGVQGAASSSVFVGSGGTITLQDSNAATVNGFSSNGSTTATFTYNFTPTINTVASATAITTFTNSLGSNGQFATSTYTTTLVGTGVAPINNLTLSKNTQPNNGSNISGSTVNLGYVLVQGPSAAATLTVSNSGNGDLAGNDVSSGGTLQSNLHGSQLTLGGNAQFNTGAGGANPFSLQDSNAATVNGFGSNGTTTATFTYNFAPTISNGSAVSASVTTTFTNGSTNGQNQASSLTTTFVGTGVAPINSVGTSNALSRFNAYGGANSGTGTAAVTISNVGNGNLAGADSPTLPSNLHGSVTGFSGSFFSQASGSNSVNLVDPTTSASLNSSTLTYTYSPTGRGTTSATVSISFNNGSTDSQNLPQSVSATFAGSGVGPTYASTYYAASAVGGRTTTSAAVTISTPPPLAPSTPDSTKEAAAHPHSTISFGSLTFASNKQVLLNISNISADLNGGNSALTDLTLESFQIIPLAGSDPSAFSVPGNPFAVGSLSGTDTLLHENDQVYLPIEVSANATGALTGYLTISTDQSAALGAAGDTFTYYLSATSISLAPEPGSLAIVSVSLGGLAFARRRRRRKQQPEA